MDLRDVPALVGTQELHTTAIRQKNSLDRPCRISQIAILVCAECYSRGSHRQPHHIMTDTSEVLQGHASPDGEFRSMGLLGGGFFKNSMSTAAAG